MIFLKNNDKNIDMEPSVMPKKVEDESAINMVNNYGTYEVQNTADTNNQYPAIAQGFNKKQVKTNCVENKRVKE